MEKHRPTRGTHASALEPFDLIALEETNNEPGSSHPYLAWPEFQTPFSYNNDDSLVIEYRIDPQETPLSDQNAMSFSSSIFSATTPRFRVYSYGTEENLLDPNPENGDIRAECATGVLPNPAKYGDNSRSFAAFDYTKITSVFRSSFVRATRVQDGIDSVRWIEPSIDPPSSSFPDDTELRIELREALDPGDFESDSQVGWVDDVSLLTGKPWIQFRVTVRGSKKSMALPFIDTLHISYERLVLAEDR